MRFSAEHGGVAWLTAGLDELRVFSSLNNSIIP